MGKYGLKIKPCSTRKYDYKQCVGSKVIGNQKQIDLPKFFELNMRSFCDIKNQKLVSSCVAFACSILAECEQYKRTQKTAGQRNYPCLQHNSHNSRTCGNTACCLLCYIQS